jgi:hypothetical protein
MRPIKFHQMIKEDCFAAIQEMPTSFKTLHQARM